MKMKHWVPARQSPAMWWKRVNNFHIAYVYFEGPFPWYMWVWAAWVMLFPILIED